MKLQFGELKISPRVVDRLHELDFTVPELESAIADHKSDCDGAPSVYVGTYRKYNEGSLRGLWIDLTSFDDYDEFINFCLAIHADEDDPELMAQDYEEFPRDYYTEGFISREDFLNILKFSELCENYDAEAIYDYLERFDELDDFEEAFIGHWNSEEDFARHIIDECYDLERAMGSLAMYFDYERFAYDLFIDGYYRGEHGNVFRVN
ncbi:MAG: antirestriction protein ArdA [Muribaculaceae bacterium]|nr:antirestriction protein ArdA [Muribaculaceae bacterium]